MYIKGYRIYRSNSEFRRGTVIKANMINAQTYIVYEITRRQISKNENKNEEANIELTVSNIYLEPDKESKYEEIIPEGIRNGECIAGY